MSLVIPSLHGLSFGGNGVPTTRPPQPVIPWYIGMNYSGRENPFGSGVNRTEVAYFAGLGFKNVRYPLLWNGDNFLNPDGKAGIQHTLDGPLDTAFLNGLRADLVIFQAAGVTEVILDMHAFGAGYFGSVAGYIGDPGAPTGANFLDMWSKFVDWIVALPLEILAIITLDQNNEWVDTDIELIFALTQQWITMCRAKGYTGLLYVEGRRYTSGWAWSDVGNDLLFALFDPLNKLIFEPHQYNDENDSGIGGSYRIETGAYPIHYNDGRLIPKVGSTPLGVPVGPGVGSARMLRQFIPSKDAHGALAAYGEYGSPSWDFPEQGGTYDWAAWAAVDSNTLTTARAANVPVYRWAYGPEFGALYGYGMSPTNAHDPRVSDFGPTGLQSPFIAVAQEFMGYTGPQPLGMSIRLPYTSEQIIVPGQDDFSGMYPSYKITPVRNAQVGVETEDFVLLYGGKITQAGGVTITFRDRKMEGQSAGGTFNPASIHVPQGAVNFVLRTKYTAAYAGTIQIDCTNDGGLLVPPAVGLGTAADDFTTLPATINRVDIRRRTSSLIDPALLLLRGDGAYREFYFNNRGDLPRQAIQDWAGSRSISIAARYAQDYSDNDATWQGGLYPQLNLSGDYPTIDWPSGAQMVINTPDQGATELSIFGRMSATANGDDYFRQDSFVGPICFGTDNFAVGNGGATQSTVAMGGSDGTTQATYCGTFKSGGSIIGYKNGAVNATAVAATYSLDAPYGPTTNLGYFRFYPVNFAGIETSGPFAFLRELTAAQVAALDQADRTYYSTPLPDTLAPLPAAPAETPFAAPSGTWTPANLKGWNIGGAENPYPQTSNPYNYKYPGDEEIDYVALKGHGCIRMPLLARRLQPASYGPLDPAGRSDELASGYENPVAGTQTNLLAIKRVLDRAYGLGISVILDLHDFGHLYDTRGHIDRQIAGDAEATAQFVDLWQRLATKFKNYPNAMWGLENEPSGTAADIKVSMVAAINAISAITTAQIAIVPGAQFTSSEEWYSAGSAAAWGGYTPPAGMRCIWEGHSYFDPGKSGQDPNCVVGVGGSRFQPLIDWAAAETPPKEVFMSEFGWSQDASTNCPPEGAAAMAYLKSKSVVKGWTYFLGGSRLFSLGATYSIVPDYNQSPPTDRPQMATLVANL